MQQQAAYMLHARPWSESSLLVDVFTREYGRFRVLAKGARRQKTGSRAQLQSFQKLQISWSGRRSLHTLTGVEITAIRPISLPRSVLASLYYMNELVFKLLHANDAHEKLFDAYDEGMQRLTNGDKLEDVLRFFECALLSEIGYGLILDRDASTGEQIDAQEQYFYYPERGPVRLTAMGDAPVENSPIENFPVENFPVENSPVGNASAVNEQALQISGACLQQLAQRRFNSTAARRDSKHLLRNLLSRQLKGEELHTRIVLRDLLKYAPN